MSEAEVFVVSVDGKPYHGDPVAQAKGALTSVLESLSRAPLSYVLPGRPVTWQRTNVVNGRPLTDRRQREEKRRIAWSATAARVSWERAHGRRWPLTATYRAIILGYWPDAKHGDCDRLQGLALDGAEGVLWDSDRRVKASCGFVSTVSQDHARVCVVVTVIE